ncbi:hypothetical protein NA57DRAFT_77899 [Rhizodiscina lignyota]|uniref:Extracellular serine-rich protein n=1 Tax=Rhizodiscina lignyota TaxID=1504668 RepID=A0A9P4M7T8_9PEZI|nr:hypothetical protein NA57DRAFT_77899 [Rhizodiscina lignyota]
MLFQLLPVAIGFLSLAVASPAPTTARAVTSESSDTSTITSSPSSSSASSQSSTSSKPQTWTVSVGKATNQFQPDVIQADVGDIVEFDFFPPNHSVARAEYKYPCIPYELTGRGKVGFFSGFMPVDAILSSPPTYSIRVNDSYPVFFYCTAPGSCTDWQMVGVINPNASVSLGVQKELAKDSDYMLQPGQDFPAEASSSIVSMGATATAESTTSNSATSTATPVPEGHSSISNGAIAGISIGGAAVVILGAALMYYVCARSRSHRHHQPLDPRYSAQPMPIAPGGGAPPEMISSGGVLYVPIANAPPNNMSNMSMRQSSVTVGSDIPPYQQPFQHPGVVKSPDIMAQEQGFGMGYNPMNTQTQRSSSPGGALDEYNAAFRSPVERPMSTETSNTRISGKSGRRSNIHEMFAPLPNQDPHSPQ